jgi:Arc/MetJ-type ribon-helix-helix transcriptional regulator
MMPIRSFDVSSQTKPISVRFPEVQRQHLERLARIRDVSVSEYVRTVVTAHLDQPDAVGLGDAVEGVHDEVQRLRAEVSNLRRDVALTLETVLVNLTDGDDNEVADFVNRHLRGASNAD